jgi:hypothetical protein
VHCRPYGEDRDREGERTWHARLAWWQRSPWWRSEPSRPVGPADASPVDIGDPAVADPAVRTTSLTSARTSYPEDVNRSPSRVTLWIAGRPLLLPEVPGYSRRGGPVVINDLGQVAWTVWAPGAEGIDVPAGVVWRRGRTVRLGRGTVTDIGEGGDIIGRLRPALDHAVIWSVDWRAVLSG